MRLRGRIGVFVATAGCISMLGCSHRVLSAIFDLPPREETAEPAPAAQPSATLQPTIAPEDTVRPPIEDLQDPDSVVSLLPRDPSGNIDWMAALEDGVIDPRHAIPGSDRDGEPDGFRFGFDFFLPGPDSSMNAFFPHSSHTQWVDCAQCHARIFPIRNTPISMGEIFQGKYCGECHGKVAFPVMTDCERCHVNLSMPPDRAEPDLIGTIVMTRVAADTAPANSGGALPPRGLRTDGLPPAQFSHWVHRIRYRCNVCHMEIFEPRAGANVITMRDISAGQACGQCHNGQVAFAAGFGACQRCHVASARPGPDG